MPERTQQHQLQMSIRISGSPCSSTGVDEDTLYLIYSQIGIVPLYQKLSLQGPSYVAQIISTRYPNNHEEHSFTIFLLRDK